ncbi:MAG: LysM peptidoglycan-binding domain-containing protein, partial [Clostridiales bacterium]|nr:LysM peptidoglycan-binding domain-containing protein [Clostridiales bacterium]
VYGAPADGGIEVRVPLEVRAYETTKSECAHIVEIDLDEERPLDIASLPSLVLARVSKGDNLWTLAKKHHSTSELIAGANELEDEAELPNVLVIPKKR